MTSTLGIAYVTFLELRSPDFSPHFARVGPYIRVYLPFLSLSRYLTSRKTEGMLFPYYTHTIY